MKRRPLKISWRAWCLDRLAKRDYSVHELREALEKRAAAADQVVDAEAVVSQLVADGLVDDRRYVENQIAMHTGSFALKGPRELARRLRIKGGISESLIAEFIDPEDRQWYDLARNYCLGLLKDDSESALQISHKDLIKLKNRLYRKGFSRSQITYALQDFKPVREQRTESHPGEIERWVAKRISEGRGPYDILQFLKQKGYPEREIQAQLDVPDEVWVEQAMRARSKRFGSAVPGSMKEKRKQIDFLKRRGYLFEHINQVFDAP